jgi:hypothetical protein
MDRPERPEQSEPSSIFSKPDPFDGPAAPPASDPAPAPRESTLDPMDVSTWGPPAQAQPGGLPPRPGGTLPPSRDGSGPSRRTLAGLGLAGLAAIFLLGFFVFTVLLGDQPAVAAAASPTAKATAVVTPSADATTNPSPSPTPEATPTGPPQEFDAGGWATVAVDELNVRVAPGTDAASDSILVRGAIVHVIEGPQVVGDLNWYRIISLGGAAGWAVSGWEAEPYLEAFTRHSTLTECGQVRRPVFDVTAGSATPNDPLQIGEFALPTGAFSDLSLAAMELYRGMGQEACFSARLGPDGQPDLSAELGVSACGHASVDGSIYRLEPTDDGSVPLASQVMESTIVHPALLNGGPADLRMSSNILTIVSMMTNAGTSGCMSVNVTQRADATESYRSVQATQCSLVNLYNRDSIKLSPRSGGPEAWIKVPASNFQPGLFPIGQTVTVSVDASVDDNDNLWASAWPYGEDRCG